MTARSVAYTSRRTSSKPTAPSSLTASSGNQAVSLSWRASTDRVDAVAGYGIFRNKVQVAQVTSTSYKDSGLTDGTAYSYYTVAYDTSGNVSSASNTVSATPVSGSSSPMPVGVPGGWKPSFDDEFLGSSLNASNWVALDGWSMNNVTTHAGNVSVSGGDLALTLASSSSGAFVSSSLSDGAGVGYMFPVGSYIEARIMFPGSGTTIYNWPGLWTSGPNWPAAGEIDIAEGLGTLTVNYHSPSGTHNFGTIPGNWAGAFHTYGVYRAADHCDVYYDGQFVKMFPTDDNGQPQSVLINVGSGNTAVYGSGSQVLVDYVRAWS